MADDTEDQGALAQAKSYRDTGAALKAGREALGWDVERMAANAASDVVKVTKNEQGSQWDLQPLMMQILTARDVQFRDNGQVLGPLSDQVLKDMDLPDADKALLVDLKGIGSTGKPLVDSVQVMQGRKCTVERLVEMANVQTFYAWPSGVECINQPTLQMRLSERGKSWLDVNGVS